jgi:phosphate transport system protein
MQNMDETLLEKKLASDMQTLSDRVRGMADMVLKQLNDAVSAFADGARPLAYKVVLRDHNIDMLEHHIDRLCQEFLIRHMPVAEQLRFVVAVSKINSELERIGDYAVGIARRAVAISESTQVPEQERILEMSKLAFDMLRRSVDAFLEEDAELAMRTLNSDIAVDKLNTAVFESLARPDNGFDDLMVRFALLGLINRVERVADRACNIAEETVYVAKGQVLRHLPREDVRVLFLCDDNGCRSQMAEGIARKVAPAHFLFSSAGPNPTDLDRRAVDFLGVKQIDISRQHAKGIDAVGPIEDFNIVVTLSQGAEDACPELPYNAVGLNWDIPDCSKVTGSDEEVRLAYETTYEKLYARIEDLAGGLATAFEEEETLS